MSEKNQPEEFYNIFKQRCISIIDTAIKKQKQETELKFKQHMTPYESYNITIIEKIYDELEELYWNKYGISLDFEGYDLGSTVTIYYTFNDDDLRKLMCMFAIKNDPDKIKLEISNKVNELLPIAVNQLEEMKSKESQHIIFENKIDMTGFMYPYFYREMSKKLENLGLGKIIKCGSVIHILKL